MLLLSTAHHNHACGLTDGMCGWQHPAGQPGLGSRSSVSRARQTETNQIYLSASGSHNAMLGNMMMAISTTIWITM